MGRFRYRTIVLVGPWQRTPEAAEDDAILAGQAFREAEGGMLHWRVNGRIERAVSFAEEPDSPHPGAGCLGRTPRNKVGG